MPMHISPTIDTGPGRIATMLPRITPIANSLSPATQGDILGILQREQDRAVALLSSSPLLSSLFVSYANQAAAFECASATSPSESEEWKALEDAVSALQGEVDKLKPENLEMSERLEAAVASMEAFRSQVASLKEVNTIQQHEIKALRTELNESKDKYNRLLEDSNVERDTLQSAVSGLEAERAELKETLVGQQIKISRLERQGMIKGEEGKAEQEAEENARRQAKRREEGQKPPAFATPSPWGSAIAKNNRTPKKAPGPSRKEQKSEWGSSWDFGAAEKKEKPSNLPPIITSPIPGGSPNPVDNAVFSTKDLSYSTDEERKGVYTPSNLSVVTIPAVPATVSAALEDGDSDSSVLDAERRPSPVPPRSAHTPEAAPEAFANPPSEVLKVQEDIGEEVLTAPKPRPVSPFSQAPAPVPTKNESEIPLSLWERKKIKAAKDSETIAMPTTAGFGDRRSIFTDTARDEKRDNERENLVEGFLGSSLARRSNDSAQSQMTAKPAPRPAPAPARQMKTSGWGSWGSSLLNTVNTVANVVAEPDRPPSPEPPTIKPKIEAPCQPPKNKPAAFGSPNGPTWGGVKNSPPPIAQKASGGSPWAAKPIGGGFGSGSPAWGPKTGSSFGSGIGQNLTVDTSTKSLESSPNTAGPENIPESAIEIKHVPTPRGFGNSIASNVVGGEQPVEGVEGPAMPEEPVIPKEEEFDWGNVGKKGPSRFLAQTPSVPNTPDPDNADDGPPGGPITKKKKKKIRR